MTISPRSSQAAEINSFMCTRALSITTYLSYRICKIHYFWDGGNEIWWCLMSFEACRFRLYRREPRRDLKIWQAVSLGRHFQMIILLGALWHKKDQKINWKLHPTYIFHTRRRARLGPVTLNIIYISVTIQDAAKYLLNYSTDDPILNDHLPRMDASIIHVLVINYFRNSTRSMLDKIKQGPRTQMLINVKNTIQNTI